jgi:16S rRNA (cytosine967-C5)-methyltransferase
MTRRPFHIRQSEVLVEIIGWLDREVLAGNPADAMLASMLRDRRELGARDRRLIYQAAFSHFRWRGWMVDSFAQPLPSSIALAFMLDAPASHPAIDHLASTQGLDPAALSPCGDQPVAQKARALARWLGAANPPRIESLVPAWLPPSLHVPDGNGQDTHATQVIEALQTRPPTWLRVRARARQSLAAALRDGGVTWRAHVTIEGAWSVPGSVSLDAARKSTASGFEVQDLASQAVGRVCNPQPGASWWDACSGSGGKSLHLAELMKHRGNILATDIRSGAIQQLRRRLAEGGVSMIRPQLADPAQPQPATEPFDGVLVDAPCAGVGTWSRNPDARWRTSADDVRRHSETQLSLLRQASACVRSGGALVYSVCSLTGAETVEVVRAFASAAGQFAPEDFPHPLTGSPTGGSCWVWPWDGPCDGMFIARFRRR